jgi:hypothetical protein
MPARRVVSTKSAGAPTVAGLPTFMRATTTKPIAPKPIPPRPPVAGIQTMPANPMAPAPVAAPTMMAPVAAPTMVAPAPVQAAPVMAPVDMPAVPAGTGFAPVQEEAPISPLERYLQQLEQRRRQMAGNVLRTGEQLA